MKPLKWSKWSFELDFPSNAGIVYGWKSIGIRASLISGVKGNPCFYKNCRFKEINWGLKVECSYEDDVSKKTQVTDVRVTS